MTTRYVLGTASLPLLGRSAETGDELDRYIGSSNDFRSATTPGTILSRTDKNAWILYTAIAAFVLILLILFVLLYDLCSRCCDQKDQVINDGGPPVSPSSQNTYTITIRVDEASSTFDAKSSILRIDLLDSQNQYMTNLAIPCFVFKLKSIAQASPESPPSQPSPRLPAHQLHQLQQYQQVQHQTGSIKSVITNHKSLSGLYETWSNTTASDVISFKLVRRMPLVDFASIRLTHDCYLKDAYLTFRYITIRDDLSNVTAKIDLQEKNIYAPHPCPASGLQVFSIENKHQLESKHSSPGGLTKFHLVKAPKT